MCTVNARYTLFYHYILPNVSTQSNLTPPNLTSFSRSQKEWPCLPNLPSSCSPDRVPLGAETEIWKNLSERFLQETPTVELNSSDEKACAMLCNSLYRMMELDLEEDFSDGFKEVMRNDFKRKDLGAVMDAWCAPRSAIEQHMVGSIIFEKTLIVAICGSSKDADWLTNFDGTPSRDPYFNETFPNMRVHNGFCGLVRDLFCNYVNPPKGVRTDYRLPLLEIAKRNGVTRVIITGHSLGGGCAQLALFMSLCEQRHPKERSGKRSDLFPDNTDQLEYFKTLDFTAITFAAPMVFYFDANKLEEKEKIFCEEFQRRSENFVFTVDIVPHLPGDLKWLTAAKEDLKLLARNKAMSKLPAGWKGVVAGPVAGPVVDQFLNWFIKNAEEKLSTLSPDLCHYKHLSRLVVYEPRLSDDRRTIACHRLGTTTRGFLTDEEFKLLQPTYKSEWKGLLTTGHSFLPLCTERRVRNPNREQSLNALQIELRARGLSEEGDIKELLKKIKEDEEPEKSAARNRSSAADCMQAALILGLHLIETDTPDSVLNTVAGFVPVTVDFTTVNFQNPRFDCFMNASLQVILRLPGTQVLPTELENLGRNDPVSDGAGRARALSELVPRFLNPTEGQISSLNLRAAFADPQFALDRQHDADEFILALLNAIDSTTLEISTLIRIVPRTYRTVEGDKREVHYCTIEGAEVEIDGPPAAGEAIVRPEGQSLLLRDKNCHNRLMVPFPMDITPTEVIPLSRLFTEVLRSKTIIEEGENSVAIEQIIEEAPSVLIVVIGRYRTFGEQTERLRNNVIIPLNGLDFGKKQYKLHGVVNHRGESASMGHYTATVRVSSGAWLNYDDLGSVTTVTLHGPEMVSDEAYVVVYTEVTDGSINLPTASGGLEPRITSIIKVGIMVLEKIIKKK